MRHLVIHMDEHEQNAWHYLRSHSWHPNRLTLCGQALWSKHTFVVRRGARVLMCYSIYILIHLRIDYITSLLFLWPASDWLLLVLCYIQHRDTAPRYCLHWCSLSTTRSHSDIEVPPSKTGLHKRLFHKRHVWWSITGHFSVLFSNSLFVVKPVIWHLHTEAGSLCVPLLSQSEPHRKSDSSLQRETKTPSFIFHNLELFKSLCFLFLFLPIMPSKMSPLYVVIGGWFHKDELYYSKVLLLNKCELDTCTKIKTDSC